MDIASTTQRLPIPVPVTGVSADAKDGSQLPPGGKSSPPVAAPTSSSVESAVAAINSYLGDSQRELNFSIDYSSGETVIRVVNPTSGEVIRQIPSEEALKIAAALSRDGLHTFDALA